MLTPGGGAGGLTKTADMRRLLCWRSIIVEDRADAAALGELGIAAQPEQVHVKHLIAPYVTVTNHRDGDRLRRLAWLEGQRAGLGDVVLVAGRGGAVHGVVRQRHGLIGGGRERDREGEQGLP